MTAINGAGEWTFGIQLPIQTLTRTLVDPWEDAATVADLGAIAKACDQAGYGFIGVCDHIAIPDNDYAAHMTTTWYDTVATLGFLAGQTSTVRLLSAVYVAAYRHPLATASAFATLDHLSGGRAILGVGAGHVEAEFEALGVDFTTRGKRLDEILEAVRGAFDDEYVSHSGRFFEYRDVGVGPSPVGELPIWVGGSGAASWKRAGRYGDGWIPMGLDKAQYPEAIAVMADAAAEAGRDRVALDVGYMPPWCYLLEGTPDDLPPTMLAGGPEALADDIGSARAAGANTMHLKFRSRSLSEYLEQVEAFAEVVVPAVDGS
jgi:probable F420-dependent oxidoreductase